MSKDRFIESVINEERLQQADITNLLASPLGDSVQILPAMLKLSSEDKELIRTGSAQRTRVLQHLWNDLVLGEMSFKNEDSFKNLSDELIENVFRNQGKTLEHVRGIWKNRTKEDITATSGSDLVRLKDGKWYAIEDNLGNISGRASTFPVQKKFYEVISQEKKITNDLNRAIDTFKTEKKKVNPIVILPPNKNEFKERERYLQTICDLGLCFTEVDKINESFEPNGLINFNLKDYPDGKKGIAKLFKDTSIPFFEAPYFKIICDKTFFPFIDDLCRFYLNEEPLIPSLPSKRWNLRTLPSELKNKVLKLTSGHQGDGIYIFDEMSDTQVEELRSELLNLEVLPEMLIQERVFPSVLKNLRFDPDEDFQLEIRCVNYAIGFQKIYTSENLTARVIPLSSGDSRCHISRGALFTPVN